MDNGEDTDESNTLNPLEKKMLEQKSYPDKNNPRFQEIIFKKTEFFANAKIPLPKFETYDDLAQYRFSKCGKPKFEFNEHQKFLANFINPDTPYNGILICHGTGTGKTASSIAILKTFFPQVEKYHVPIHVVVPGTITRENYAEELYKFIGDEFQVDVPDPTIIMTEEEKDQRKKDFMIIIRQYVRIMSHASFYKKVLGEKIRDTSDSGSKYRKTDTGDYERDVSIDQILSLDNTLLIIDEVHRMIENMHGEAIVKIINSSHNLKTVFMSATPMKDVAPEIVGLINYLRPKNQKIEKSKAFVIDETSGLYKFKPGGKDYLRKMVRGYVSYLRGNDPITFARRNEVGEIPPGLSFTRVTRCQMLPFQLSAYNEVSQIEDNLDRHSSAVANFVFPGLKKGTKDVLHAFYGISGLNDVRNQMKNNHHVICQLVADTILKEYNIKNVDQIIDFKDEKTITGLMFQEPYLKYFSIKFYYALLEINSRINDKKCKIFCYSNLVKVGVALFKEVLLMNGYLEYDENPAVYNISKTTRCYACDHRKDDHAGQNHTFHPATFMVVVGKLEEDTSAISDTQSEIIRRVFNSKDNLYGKDLKIIVGSQVMNEGITLSEVGLGIPLDPYFNLSKTEQAVGRTIRFCKHYLLYSPENPYPSVDIYKFVVIANKNELSSEERMYQRAEEKFKLVMETMTILKEEAIDCPNNYPENVFTDELEKYANCGDEGKEPCPAVCGYQSCDFQCADKTLNAKYYDADRHIYRRLKKNEFDHSTFSVELAREEIDDSKNKIKDLFKLSHFYTLDEIIDYVKNKFPEEKQDLFDNYFVYRALDELIPINTNDFNNFHDTFLDKYNNQGYIIYRHPYYIFQQFNKPETLPMIYRRLYRPDLQYSIGLKDYLDTDPDYSKFKDRLVLDDKNDELTKLTGTDTQVRDQISNYDFNSNRDYYEKRKEFAYVGVIDRESSHRKTKTILEIKDVFKIRQKRPPVPKKKREIGLPSYKGAVCEVSKDKNVLIDILKSIGVKPSEKSGDRSEICQDIKNRLFELEKYSPGSEKITYLIIPSNHPTIPFPLNLDDRVEYILKQIKDETKLAISPKIDKKKVGVSHDLILNNYTITIKNPDLSKYTKLMTDLGGVLNSNKEWIIKLS